MSHDTDLLGGVDRILLTVFGKAETQGSKVPRHANGKSWVTEGNTDKAKRHKSWREAIADKARDWQDAHGAPGLLTGEVVVLASFYLQKPAAEPKRRRTWPIKARSGDADKLLRSVLDSLTGTILADDSQVVCGITEKDWGDPPRVEVQVVPVPDGTCRVVGEWRFVALLADDARTGAR